MFVPSQLVKYHLTVLHDLIIVKKGLRPLFPFHFTILDLAVYDMFDGFVSGFPERMITFAILYYLICAPQIPKHPCVFFLCTGALYIHRGRGKPNDSRPPHRTVRAVFPHTALHATVARKHSQAVGCRFAKGNQP